MLYREIIALCSQINTKHINALCGQNVEFLNIELLLPKLITGLKMFKSYSYSSFLLYLKCLKE